MSTKNKTKNLKLPQYQNDDLFDMKEVNEAYKIIDESYKEQNDNYKQAIETSTINGAIDNLELIDARKGKRTLGEKISEIDEELSEIDSQLDSKVNKSEFEIYIDDYKGYVINNDWTNAFSKAIEVIKKNNGGKLILGCGTYMTDCVILTKGMSLVGKGFSTVIKQNINSNTPLISLETDTTKFVTVKNLTLDGNRFSKTVDSDVLVINTNDQAEYEDGTGDIHAMVDNVFIKNASGNGLYVTGRGENIFKNIKIIYSKKNGVEASTYDTWFENISVGCSVEHGFHIHHTEATRFTDCKAWMSGFENNETECYGFNITNSQKLNFNSCESQSNKTGGFYLNSIAKTNINNFISYDNGNGDNESAGIIINESSLCNINGISCNSNASVTTQKYALNIKENVQLNKIEIICKDNSIGELLDSNKQANSNIINILGNNKVSNTVIGKLMLGTGSNSDLSRLYIRTDDDFPYGQYMYKTTKTDGNKNVVRYDLKNDNTGKSAFFEVRIEPNNNEVILLSEKTIIANSDFKIIDSRWDNKHFIMGHYHFWVDSTQKLRIKYGAPSSDTDGTIVGSQS